MTVPATRTIEAGLDEPTRDLAGVELFRAGDYGQRGFFSEAYLDAMAANYRPTAHEAPLTLDHAKHGPAYGWLKRVWREGDVLKGDFSGVPESMARAIERGRYKKRSIEFYELEDGGHPVIRAVSFLGAQVPHVKGLRDVQFSEPAEGAKTTTIEIDVYTPEAKTFAELVDPDPSSHGLIVHSRSSDTILDHWHDCHLDAEGNGFTGPPRCYDASPMANHQHVVLGGVIQPGGMIPHSHGLRWSPDKYDGDYKIYGMAEASRTKTGEEAMSAPAQNPPSLEPTPAPDHAALLKRMAEQEAEIALLKRQAFEREESIRFSEAFEDALAEGRVSPAERENAKAIYDALPTSGDKTIRFGEEQCSPRDAFLRGLKARPKVVEFGELANSPKNIERKPRETDPLRFAEAEQEKKTQEIMKANPGMNYAEAAAQAAKA
jgi:hypothetical protein